MAILIDDNFFDSPINKEQRLLLLSASVDALHEKLKTIGQDLEALTQSFESGSGDPQQLAEKRKELSAIRVQTRKKLMTVEAGYQALQANAFPLSEKE